MASVTLQAAMKELRTLKQEESTMMNLASKISDQLNRLKVEELALQNLVRIQNEELESKSRRYVHKQAGESEYDNGNNTLREYLEKGDNLTKNDGNESVIPLNLVVNKFHQHDDMNEEEEEEDDDDDDDEVENTLVEVSRDHDDIEQFVNSL